ncbi:hypothetical protein [Nocardia sp. MW-W600-9]
MGHNGARRRVPGGRGHPGRLDQTELGGYEFVQWPSRGGRVLRAREIDQAPVWLDPRTARMFAPIGELCSDTSW